MSTPENPWAFPHPPYKSEDGHVMTYGEFGMTLRDYFAAKIAAASFSHEKNMVCLGGGNAKAVNAIAEDAYTMADAMLKARATS